MQDREHLGPQEALGAAQAGRLDIITRLDAHEDSQVVADEHFVHVEYMRPHVLLDSLTERLKLRLDALSGAYKHPVALSLNVVDHMGFHARVGTLTCSEGQLAHDNEWKEVEHATLFDTRVISRLHVPYDHRLETSTGIPLLVLDDGPEHARDLLEPRHVRLELLAEHANAGVVGTTLLEVLNNTTVEVLQVQLGDHSEIVEHSGKTTEKGPLPTGG